MIDLLFTEKTDATVRVPFIMSDKDTATGSQLLAQKVIILILTPLDDVLRQAGGGLYESLKSANVSEDSLERLTNTVNIVITEVVSIISTEQSDMELPDTERLSRIELEDITIPVAGTLSMVLTIVPVSGEPTNTTVDLEI